MFPQTSQSQRGTRSACTIEPLESRIAPAAFVLPAGAGPFSLELDGAQKYHILNGVGTEIFTQGAQAADDLFVTGGNAADKFTIATSAAGNVAFTGTLSVNIPGAIDVRNPVTTGTDLELISGLTITQSAAISLGASTAHYTAAKGMSFTSTASLTTVGGDIVLLANQGVAQGGTFIGIVLDGASIVTTGSGKITLAGTGGDTSANNAGILITAGAHITSTSATPAAGTITLTGKGGAGTGADTGILLTGVGSLVSSVAGAISLNGTGQGTGNGNAGVQLADGAQITSTGTAPGAASIAIDGTGGGGVDFSRGVFLDGTINDPKITTVVGNILVTGKGGTTATGQAAHGVALQQGAQILSSGTGNVTLIGTAGAGTISRQGILITDAGTLVGSQSGSVNVTGTGGGGGAGSNNNGVLVGAGGKISAQGTTGTVTVTGTEGAGANSEGIALGANNSTIESLGGSGLSLIANNININTAAAVSAGTGVAKLRPKTAGTLIDFGGPDVATGTLGITGAELHQITGSAIELGDANTGAISLSAALSPERSLTLTTGSTVNGAGFTLNMLGGGNLTVSADGGISFGGPVTVPVGTASFAANAISSITVMNAGNNFATVTIPSGGGLGVAILDNSGFNLGPTNVATLLNVQSDATITQTGVFSGNGALTKNGTGTLVLTATNTYSGTTTISGGTLQVGNASTTGTLGTGAVVNNGTLVFARSDALNVPNPISGNGNVQNSLGTTTLAGNNDYSGATNVNGGTLLVTGTLSNTASVAVVQGAALGGSGSINTAAQINVSGTISPGGSPGVLQTGNVAFAGGSAFNVEVNGAALANHDQLTVTGTVALGNAALTATGTVASVPGQQIVLIDNDGNDAIPDTFNGLPEGSPVTINGVSFKITYAGGVGANDVVLVQPAFDTELTLAAGDLVVTDVTAGGHDDALTIKADGNGNLIVSDPSHLLQVTAIAGASVDVAQHTATIPLAAITGTKIAVNSLGGDDSVTVDVSVTALPKALTYDGGTSGLTGDTLALAGGNFTSTAFDFTGAGSGGVTLPGSAAITYSGTETVRSATPAGSVTLNYSLPAANALNIANGGNGILAVTPTTGARLLLANPTTLLTINGGSSDDTFNLNSLDATFIAGLSLDGKAGADAVNVAPGLPRITALTAVTETIASLPAINFGIGGVDINATAGGIDVGGAISSTGPVKLQSSGAITNSAGAIAATNVSLTAADSIAMALDGAGVVASVTGAGGVALKSVNNPVSINSLQPGTGGVTLSGGTFRLNKTDAIAGAPGLKVDGTLDLRGFLQTVAGLTGAGTITNSDAALSTFTLGADAGGGTFSGSIGGHLALAKIGAGTQIIAGPDDHADGTTIGAGTLQFTATGTALDGRFGLAGGSLFYDLTGPADTLSPKITLSQDSSIGVGSGKVVTLTDVLSGPGGLTKIGAGRLVLTNPLNTFGGQAVSVNVNAGTLETPNDGALGDPANRVVLDNATFAASAAFLSGRNFIRAGGVATIEVNGASLTLLHRAIVPGDLIAAGSGPLRFQVVYADGAGTPVPTGGSVIVGGTTVTLGGGGSAQIHTDSFGSIEAIELSGTSAATKLVIKGPTTGTTTIDRIVINDGSPGTIASIGSIVLGKNVLLGDGVRDSVPDLYVEGKAGKIQLYDLDSYALIRLGEGLPYEILRTSGKIDTAKPQTKTNHPDFSIHEVRGPGTLIDVTGDGASSGVGGGGLGKVVVDRWASTGIPGAIRTTQSIGSFKLANGDCTVVFEVDKRHVGSSTTANVGSMTIQNGAWGSTGSEIEGDVHLFDADAFLAGATLTAASMGLVTVGAGDFAGIVTLLDGDAPGIPTFTVNSDFTGSIVTAAPIKKIKVKGDFMGSLEAFSIGAISAYSFIGSDTPGDPDEITATSGGLGTFTSSAGVVRNFSITTDQAFKGFNVKLGSLTGAGTAVGIDNVHITALSIGNISVNLAATPTGAAGVNLIGIRNSDFVTTGTGTTKTTAGNIGNITVTLTGGSGGGAAIGIQDSTFDAQVTANEFGTNPASTVNALGKIAVKISGQDGVSLGLLGFANVASFSADTIGATTVSVTPGKGPSATATAIDTAEFTATGTIGALTVSGSATGPMVNDLHITAGATVGAVTVKSAVLANGTLKDSTILAGQSLSLTDSDPAKLRAALARATLGAITVSGSILNTDLVAGSAIGAVTAGGALTDSLILAGARLGSDRILGGVGDSFQRAASIAAITVKGAFTTTTIAAGVNPVNGIIGDPGDTIAATAGVLTNTSSIGPITLSAGLLTALGGSQQFAIEAAKITSLKLGAAPAISITTPQLLDLAPLGLDANDVIVRLVA
jgi:autotransporter-associated beta strand protein